MANGFTTSNGQILDPNGQPFTALGINVGVDQLVSDFSAIISAFPGLNFIRVPISSYADPSTYAQAVQMYSAKGIVLEFEDHTSSDGSDSGGGQGTIFQGQELQDEMNWYASMAAYYANNPYVWFGTDNEPSEVNPATGQTDPAALSNWQLQTYQTIRNAGNNSPILLEANSGPSNGQPVTNQGYNPADYTGMVNTIWDIHYYGWVVGYSTDLATNEAYLASMVQQTHQFPGANGAMPVLVGEFGDSTSGLSIDPNADQVIEAVLNSGLSYAAWIWHVGYPGDGLLSASGGLSSYGNMVAAGIAADAAENANDSSGGSSGSTSPPSANNTVLMAGAPGSLTDASGNVWTIVDGAVNINGQAAQFSANVTELAFVNGVIWQENASNLWWQWDGSGWAGGSGIAISPLPVASPDNTVIGAGGTITDAQGNSWTINASGTVDENGAAAGFTANVTSLAYVGGTIWQENANNLWWQWNGTAWGPDAGTATSPLPAPPVTPDTVSVSAAGQTLTVTGGSGTSFGDNFSVAGTGVIQAVLGASDTFIQFSGTSGVQLTGGSAGSIITATGGTNSFTIGSGPMDITGGSGADAYIFHAGSGFLAIEDFSAGKGDTLTVDSSLQASMQTGSDGIDGTLISFGGNAAIDLRHVAAAPAIVWA